LLDRTESKELTQEAAAELLGINVRTFQRWAERFEAEGDDGLVDLRMGRDRRGVAPEEELERMVGLFRDKYADFTVKHFHEQLPKAAWLCAGLHGDEARLACVGPGAEGAEAFGAPQEASTPAASGDAAASGRGRAMSGSEGLPPMDLIVTLDDATSEIYSMLLVEEEGTASTVPGLAR